MQLVGKVCYLFSHMKKIFTTLWFQPYTPIIIGALIIWFAARFIYPPIQQYIQSKNPIVQEAQLPSPAPAVGNEEAIIEAVSKLIVLPADERPQIITLTDADIERFKGQPFFKNAKAGNILLIYAKNKKAILFDPVNNRIIDTAPLASPEPSPTATPTATLTPSASPTPTVEITATPTPAP